MYYKGSMNDQQLLDGVAMTTSISCEANELAEDYQLSESSGQHGQSNQRYQREESFDSSAKPSTSRRLAQTVKVHQLKERSKSQMKLHSGKTTKNVNRQWKVLMGLDDNLFEVYFLGLLENTHDMITKIGQVIVTQEYSRLKSYEKELEEAIISIQFGLNEYDRQKKAFQQQIQLLKAQNDHLNCSIVQLYNVIQSLEKEINNYFGDSLDSYLNINPKKQNILQVPFARTFSHSLEQIKTIKQTYSHSESIHQNDLDIFLQRLLKAVKDMALGSYNNSLLQLNDKLPFLCDDHFKNLFELIEDNIKTASLIVKKKQSQQLQQFPADEKSPQNFLSSFLNNFSNNRQLLLRNLKGHPYPNLYLWHIISSSVITFLGILCEQSKNCNLEMSFGNTNQLWVQNFIQEIRVMVTESKVNLKIQEKNYLECLQEFIYKISGLASQRLWKYA